VFDFLTLATVGLACAIVGVIFLSNAMGVRRPRRFIQEFFGIKRPQALRTVLDQLRAKAEIFTGFLFLMVGFSLQIVAQLAPSFGPPAGNDSQSLRLQLLAFATLTAAVLLVTIVLRLLCRAWSLSLFRRLLNEFFSEHAEWHFEKHPGVTRELGEILSIPQQAEDSIGDYAARVRAALRLPPQGPPARRSPGAGDDAFAPVRNVGADRRL
jgi:hypothetical protein